MSKKAPSPSRSITERKLDKLQQAYAELLIQKKNEHDVYTRLISRLTLACKGQNLELDNKLAELRSLLSDNQSINATSPLIQQLDELLNDHSRNVSEQISHAKQAINNRCKRLQKIRGLDSSFRRQLRECIEAVDHEDRNFIHLIPILGQLGDLYGQAIDMVSLGKVFDKDEHAEVENLKQIQREIAATIHDLLTEFEFEGKVAEKIQSERRAVVSADSPTQILQCCTNIIELILAAVAEERESSQTFLTSLDSSLTTIYSSLHHSVNASSELVQIHHESTQKLHQHVCEFQGDIEETNQLSELKKQINAHLGDILNELTEQEPFHTAEQNLTGHLSEMQTRLSALEQQAQEYRTRLDEQKMRLYRDSVTELPNRAAYDERIEIEFRRAKRYTTPLTLAIIDIDHFKRVNDNYGHIAGDKTLKVLGQMLNRWLRKTDFVARYGGEEFALLLPEQSVHNVKGVLERLCDRISKLPFKFKQKDVRISVSIGAAGCRENDTIESLFERADAALYRAKDNGRNRVELETEASS